MYSANLQTVSYSHRGDASLPTYLCLAVHLLCDIQCIRNSNVIHVCTYVRMHVCIHMYCTYICIFTHITFELRIHCISQINALPGIRT